MGLDTTLLTRTTREHFIPVLKDNLFNAMPLLKMFREKGRQKTWAGGYKLLWDVILTKHQAVGLWTGYDIIVNQQVNPVVQASLSNANYYASIGISKEEEKLNSGRMEKLLDILETQMKNAQSTLQERIAQDLYGDGTAVNGRVVLAGLKAVCDTTNTYANINRSTAGNSGWQSNKTPTTYTDANLKNPTHAGYFPHILRTGFTNASHNGSAPDIGFTTKYLYNLYQDIAEAGNLRFDNSKANLGFGGVEFQAGVPIMFDDYCTAKYFYWLTSKDFELHVVDGADFDLDTDENGNAWLQGTDQFAKIAHIIYMAQLKCDAPRNQQVFTTLGDA